MKKLLTKPAAILTAIAMLFCMITVFAVAGDSDDSITKPESFSEEESSEITTYTTNIVSHRPGDINGDGSVTVSDARLCLRYAAKLETLTNKQLNAAQTVNYAADNSCARDILRSAAKLDNLDAKYIAVVGESYTIDSLRTGGSGMYSWSCTVMTVDGEETDNVSVTETSKTIVDDPTIVGAPVNQIFTLNAIQAGEYIITFRYTTGWNLDEAIDEFSFHLTVYATGLLPE